jgi:leukotriene-A4 hydrolase
LQTVEQNEALSPERAAQLGEVYDFISTNNAEIKTAYYLVALKAKDLSCFYGTAELLGKVGRMKFVRPLYRGLDKVDRALALETFVRNKEFYHPICRAMVEKDLAI